LTYVNLISRLKKPSASIAVTISQCWSRTWYHISGSCNSWCLSTNFGYTFNV